MSPKFIKLAKGQEGRELSYQCTLFSYNLDLGLVPPAYLESSPPAMLGAIFDTTAGPSWSFCRPNFPLFHRFSSAKLISTVELFKSDNILYRADHLV